MRQSWLARSVTIAAAVVAVVSVVGLGACGLKPERVLPPVGADEVAFPSQYPKDPATVETARVGKRETVGTPALVPRSELMTVDPLDSSQQTKFPELGRY